MGGDGERGFESKWRKYLRLLSRGYDRSGGSSSGFGRLGPVSLETRPLRKDAELNRQRILAAAGELFAEAGLHVTLDAVAERAGVGVGTVYRRFPDKEALIDALFEDRIDAVGAIAGACSAIEDPWEALVAFFDRAVSLHGEDRALKELVFSAAHGRDRVARARARIKPQVGALVARAQAAGALRP